MVMIALGIILVGLAGFFKAVMDKLQFHWHRSVFYRDRMRFNPLFWNPQLSWENKYKLGSGYKEEKFKFSTTLLVFLTDAWHLAQMSTYLLIFIGLPILAFASDSLLELILAVVTARVAFGVAFELSFKKFLEW